MNPGISAVWERKDIHEFASLIYMCSKLINVMDIQVGYQQQ